MRDFRRLVFAGVIATYLLIILGGLVRATGAGLACPDWPLCHGRLIPPFEPLVLIEWSHRFIASVVGVLTLALTATLWRLRRARQPGFARLGTLALILLGIQIGLGGLTVRHALTAWLVVAHLGTAMAFFATLIVLAVTATTGSAPPRRDLFRTLAIVTVAATYALVLVGGYVSAGGAGLDCPDWPLCYGQ